MILYHGSFLEIAKPDLVHSRSNVDFGRGFYVTPLYEQAAKISEALRSGDLESAKTIMPDVKAAYKKITEALAQD